MDLNFHLFVLGDDGRWSQQGLWLCVFFFSRGSNQGCNRDEWPHCCHKATVCGSGSAQGGAPGPFNQSVHAEDGHCACSAQPSPQPISTCTTLRLFHGSHTSGEQGERKDSRTQMSSVLGFIECLAVFLRPRIVLHTIQPTS